MITNAHNAASRMVAKSGCNYLPAIGEIMALERKHKSILESRKKFLTDFIVDVCEDIFKSKNQELLPEFVRPGVTFLKLYSYLGLIIFFSWKQIKIRIELAKLFFKS